MDAKSKANFINSVAAGNTIPCPKCGTANEVDNKFCISCGAEIEIPQESDTVPAFEQSKEPLTPTEIKDKYDEPYAVFAQGLPEWSVEPPQVMVRRR